MHFHLTPKPYTHSQEEEETDELLLLDEEMLDAHPDDLPRRLLTSFAVYNAEVRALAGSPCAGCSAQRAAFLQVLPLTAAAWGHSGLLPLP